MQQYRKENGMKKIEFYNDPDGHVYYTQDGVVRKRFTRFDKDIINSLLCMIKKTFPDTYLALIKSYPLKGSNKVAKSQNQFLMTERFIRCNFGENDLLSLDYYNGIYHYEMVKCPLRGGHCQFENVICNPKSKQDVKLSCLEKNVASMYSEGVTFSEIAEYMGKSPNTIKAILHRIKLKLKLKNSRSIIRKVHINKIL